MNDWIGYIEEWLNHSSIVSADDEFDSMEKELVREFDKLTEEFDRILYDDLKDFGFSESYLGVRRETVREEVVDVILYDSYPVNLRPNKNTRVRKITRPAVPLSRIEKEEGDSSEDIIVTDKNIKVVTKLPVNNRKENIKVVAYSDNSVTITHLNSEGKQCSRTSVVPYDIDIETATSTYRNGILEITFNRK
jgi:HSP20 family protein